jgi:phenylacetate-CoA ligase
MSNAHLIRQYLESLRKSEWYSQDQLIDYQHGLLGALLTHSFETVPFYRDRIGHMFGKKGQIIWDHWSDIPILTKQDIRDNAKALTSIAIPENHGRVLDKSTSGSTGEPVTFKQTELHMIAANCLTARFQEWHGLNREHKFAEIRPYPSGEGAYPEGDMKSCWALEGLEPENPGPWMKLNISTPIAQQVDWLCRQGPMPAQSPNMLASTQNLNRNYLVCSPSAKR